MLILTRITSNEMRSILHKLMERDRHYSAYELHRVFRSEVERVEESTNRHARPCWDWTQRVAQLLCNDDCISIRTSPRSWWWSPPNRYRLIMDENDIQFYIDAV